MTMMKCSVQIAAGVLMAALLLGATGGAQTITQRPGVPPAAEGKLTPPPPPPPPATYIIGPDDVLTIFTRDEKDLSGDFVVRPDGKITMPLINEIQAAGLTPPQLRDAITTAAMKFAQNATVTVIVKQINSRKVFITGNVNRPGAYPLGGPMTVLQLIALAGGLQEFADAENVMVNRGSEFYRVNYKELSKGKNLKQNIELRPGDTVIVS